MAWVLGLCEIEYGLGPGVAVFTKDAPSSNAAAASALDASATWSSTELNSVKFGSLIGFQSNLGPSIGFGFSVSDRLTD